MKIGIIKKTGISLLGVLLPVMGIGQTTPNILKDSLPTLKVTLEETIDIALKNNPVIKVSDLEIEKKKYARKSAQSSLYPQIDAVAQYTRTIQKQVMYMDGAFDMASTMSPVINGIEDVFQVNDPSTYKEGDLMNAIVAETSKIPDTSGEGIEVGRDNNWTGGFNMNWAVVVPSLWKSLQITGLDVELSVEKARSSKIDMVNAVRKAYYSVLMAQDSYNVFKESYDNAVLNYNDIKNKFDQGIASEFDLIRANVRVKNVKPNMIQAENALSLATLSLKALMGTDMNQPVVASGHLSDYEESLYSDLMKVDTSLVNNSNLKQFDLQMEQVKKTVDLYKSQYLPVVAITGNYMYMSMNNDFKFGDYKWNPYSTVGISISIPIFDGMKKHSDIKQSQISLQQMKWQRDDIVRNLQLSVNNSISNMTNSIEQVLSTKDAVNQAQKGYVIAQKRYETGLGTLLELNDAQLSHTQAQLAFNQAIYNYLASKADLDKTLGVELK